ncbi:MAG: ORF6N domain-containing protein [Pirellulales bacterium]|nr:ORF6N domain-containing protein [Pirellulales bacterium]
MKPKPLIESLILTIRGERVMMAADLAEIYGVQTKALNQAVKRNTERFPTDFVFQLTAAEFSDLKSQKVLARDGSAVLRSQFVTLDTPPSGSQYATLKPGRYVKYPPYAFTEHGAIMAANVLNSPEAVAMSVYVVRAFVQMRERLAANAAILKRLAEIDKTLLEHDQGLRIIWQKLQPLLQPSPQPPRQRIGFQ